MFNEDNPRLFMPKDRAKIENSVPNDNADFVAKLEVLSSAVLAEYEGQASPVSRASVFKVRYSGMLLRRWKRGAVFVSLVEHKLAQISSSIATRFTSFWVGSKSRGTSLRFSAQIGLLLDSELFDPHWYRDVYPDVAESSMTPEEHYLKFGAKEYRDPSPAFSTAKYFWRNPDLHPVMDNPLLHHITAKKGLGAR